MSSPTVLWLLCRCKELIHDKHLGLCLEHRSTEHLSATRLQFRRLQDLWGQSIFSNSGLMESWNPVTLAAPCTAVTYAYSCLKSLRSHILCTDHNSPSPHPHSQHSGSSAALRMSAPQISPHSLSLILISPLHQCSPDPQHSTWTTIFLTNALRLPACLSSSCLCSSGPNPNLLT